MNDRHTRAPWPIPLAELETRRGHFKRSQDLFLIAWSLVVLAALSSFGPIVTAIQGTGEPSGWLQTLDSLALLALIGASIAWLILSTRNRLRSRGLQCPHCSRLLGSHLSARAIAAGHCGKCHTPLVSDHPGEIPATHRLGPLRAA